MKNRKKRGNSNVLYHCEAAEEEVVEYSDIVISTKSMSSDDWVNCKLFSIAVQSMHCLGLLRCFSIYLHNEKHIAYSDFYISLVQWYLNHPGTIGYDVFTGIHEVLIKMTAGINVQYYYDKRFGDVRWPLDEGAFIQFISDVDRFYNEARVFLKSFEFEEDIFEQLLEYQKKIVTLPDSKVFEITQDYDFYSYMLNSMNNDYRSLEKVKNMLIFSPDKSYASLAEYAREVVWYGRRLDKTVLTNNSDCFNLSYF